MESPSDPSLAALLEAGRDRSGLGVVPDFHAVLAHHPNVLRRILELGLGRLPDGKLTVRDRELLVLRTARLCGATYEWAHHTRRAAERGLSELDVQLAWSGGGAASSTDRLLLRVADDLHAHSTLDDATWAELSDTLGSDGAIEAVTIVGWFHMISFLGNAVGLEIEPGVNRTFGPPVDAT